MLRAKKIRSKCQKMCRKMVPKVHLICINSQIEKLRFDCAGASGSRVRAPRKPLKNY